MRALTSISEFFRRDDRTPFRAFFRAQTGKSSIWGSTFSHYHRTKRRALQRAPTEAGRSEKDAKKQSGAAKRGSRTLSSHRDGNAADGRRHFGTHLRAAELQDDSVRILQLNAAGTACDGTARTGRCVAACKVAGVVDI